MSQPNRPRSRRPITPAIGAVPPRIGGNRRSLRRVRILVGFGVALILCVLMIFISLAF